MADQGKTGFGIGSILPAPNISPDQMAAAAGNHTKLLQLIEQHLRRLADKYDANGVEQPGVFSIAVGASQKFDFSTQPHNSIIITVGVGTANLFSGDYTGASSTAVPNMGIYAAGTNQQFFFSRRGRVWTIVNGGATTLTGSFIPVET
jgi:hypothetical protein